jgi:DNA primase
MKTKWVDFAQLKQKVGMVDILENYGLLDGLKERKNSEFVGYCPIHDENRYNKSSFCVNTEKNVFNCFACGSHGNILDFVAQMEDVDIRRAGLLITEWFEIAHKEQEKTGQKRKSDDQVAKPEKEAVNPPLIFELKDLDINHPYLQERGMEKDTIREFGLGFCKRGLMKDRVAIPVHNENGELVAYAGRFAGEPPEGEPKYKLPPKFQKHLVLYNFHKAREFSGEKGLVLVEGFFDVMRVWQAGFKNVVGLMGTVLSDEQEWLLLNVLAPDGKLVLMSDPDEAGLKAAQEILERLITKLYIKIIDLQSDDMEADSLTRERIIELLGSADQP